MIEARQKQIKLYEAQLADMPKAIAFAGRNMRNDLAFETRRQSLDTIKDRMTLRNKWTERSMGVERARRPFDDAKVGSRAEYMLDQEFGATNVREGQRGVPLATAYSSGEGETARPRQRLPRARNTLRRLKLPKARIRATSKAQRNRIAVAEAVASGRREVFMDTGRKQFIARVMGSKRNPRVKMLYDLSRRSMSIPANPWHEPSTDEALKRRDRFYAKRLQQQIKRLQQRKS